MHFRLDCSKHILFLCLRVLKLSEERVQGIASGNSINSDELAEIATNAGGDIAHEFSAPKYMTQYLRSLVGDRLEDGESSKKGHVAHREPEDGDDCPICFDDLKGDGGELVYCRYGCGKAIHKECFERWRQSKERSGEQVTCVYCRTPWSVDTGGGDETKIGGRGLLLGGRLIQIGDEDHPGEPTEQLTQRVANERAKSKRKRRTEAVAGTKEGRVKKGTKKTAKKTATKKAATKKTAPKKTAKKYQQTVEEEPKQYVEPKGARKSSRIAKQHKN